MAKKGHSGAVELGNPITEVGPDAVTCDFAADTSLEEVEFVFHYAPEGESHAGMPSRIS